MMLPLEVQPRHTGFKDQAGYMLIALQKKGREVKGFEELRELPVMGYPS